MRRRTSTKRGAACAAGVCAVWCLAGAGCFVDDVGDAVLSCRDNADCPDPLRCVAAVGRCTIVGDGVGPAPSDVRLTAEVGVDGEVAVSFVVDEALLTPPLLEAAGLVFHVADDSDTGARRSFVGVEDVGDNVVDDVAVAVTLVGVDGDAARTVLGLVRIDTAPPGLVATTFSAPSVSAFSRSLSFAVTTSEPVGPPTLTTALPLTLETQADALSTTWTFAVPDLAEVPDGSFVIDEIAVVDAVGNAAHFAFPGGGAPQIVVDRIAPVVDVTALVDRASVVAGFDHVPLDIAIDGASPVADNGVSVDVFVDDAAVACDVVAGCVIDVADLDLDAGAHDVIVRAVDVAGNVGSGFAPLLVDRDAPQLTAQTVVVLRAAPGVPVIAPTEAVPGTSVSVQLATDEPFVAFASARFVHGDLALGLSPTSRSTASLVVPIDAPDGDYDLVVEALLDDVGNVADRILPAALRVARAAPTPCAVPFCADYDGDGFDGFSGSCPNGTDCNDTQPHVWPGAPEIPGDGLGNSCGTSDAAVDDDIGVFVRPDGDDAADGTRAAPVQTLARAFVVARERARPHIFLGAGSYGPEVDASGCPTSAGACAPCAAPSLHGGFDDTWRRVPGLHSTVIVRAADVPADGSARHFDGLRLEADAVQVTGIDFVVDGNFGNGVHVCSRVTSTVSDVSVAIGGGTPRLEQNVTPGMLVVEGTSVVDRSTMVGGDGTVALRYTGTLRVVDARMRGGLALAPLASSGTLFAARDFFEGRVLDKPQTSSTIVSSLIESTASVSLLVDGSAALYGSTIRSLSSTANAIRIDPTSTQSRTLFLARDVLITAPSGRAIVVNGDLANSVDVAHVTVPANFAFIRDTAVDVVLDVNGFNACDESGDLACVAVDDVVARDVEFVESEVTLTPSSPDASAAQELEAAVSAGAPTTLIADINGRCRALSGGARGAAEAVP